MHLMRQTDKDEPKKVGMAKEANDEITAEFKYIVVKLRHLNMQSK